jgi:hypothetical protein
MLLETPKLDFEKLEVFFAFNYGKLGGFFAFNSSYIYIYRVGFELESQV